MSINQADLLSVLDSRYYQPELVPYLSNGAAMQHQLEAELALVRALGEYGVCPESLLKEVEIACSQITVEEVDAEEKRIKHDIRALVNCIRNKVSEEHRQYIHMTATSYDIIDTANALRFRGAVLKVLVPSARRLIKVLAALAIREADTVQIGRTHGQHAIPITFGFAIAGYVSRLGNSVERLVNLADELTGKFSGAVGAYNVRLPI
jgi:adenylosuccinate lyase